MLIVSLKLLVGSKFSRVVPRESWLFPEEIESEQIEDLGHPPKTRFLDPSFWQPAFCVCARPGGHMLMTSMASVIFLFD